MESERRAQTLDMTVERKQVKRQPGATSPRIIPASMYDPDSDPHRFWSKWGPKSLEEWKRPWWLDGAE